MTDNLFKSGQHPLTGDKAMRATVYELLQQIKGVPFRPCDITSLMPNDNPDTVASALRGLAKNPDAYPGVHRIGRGQYLFDPSKAQQWMTFPHMARRKRVGKRVVAVNRKKAAAEKVNPVMEAFAKAEARTQAEAVIADVQRLGSFVEVLPVFDHASGKFMPTTDAVLLRDDENRLWTATRLG